MCLISMKISLFQLWLLAVIFSPTVVITIAWQVYVAKQLAYAIILCFTREKDRRDLKGKQWNVYCLCSQKSEAEPSSYFAFSPARHHPARGWNTELMPWGSRSVAPTGSAVIQWSRGSFLRNSPGSQSSKWQQGCFKHAQGSGSPVQNYHQVEQHCRRDWWSPSQTSGWTNPLHLALMKVSPRTRLLKRGFEKIIFLTLVPAWSMGTKRTLARNMERSN